MPKSATSRPATGTGSGTTTGTTGTGTTGTGTTASGKAGLAQTVPLARTLKGAMLFVLPAFQSVPASAASGSGSGSGSGEGAHKWLTYIVDTSSGNITVDEMVGGNFGRSRADRKKKKAKRDQKFFFWIFLPHRVAV